MHQTAQNCYTLLFSTIFHASKSETCHDSRDLILSKSYVIRKNFLASEAFVERIDLSHRHIARLPWVVMYTV